MTSAKFFEFGPFRVDAGRRVLTRDGEPVPLAPKPFALLLHFLRHPGQALSKEKLIDVLWADGVGSEANLNVNIAAIRRALGERPRDHNYVVTLPLRGYSFVADVRRVASSTPGKEDAAPGDAPRRLAVLPFEVSNPGAEDEHLGAGFADAISTGVAQFGGWAVQSPSTVRRLASEQADPLAVGRELGADAILTGRIDQDGDRTIVSVRVTQISDEAVLWGSHYSKDPGSLTLLPGVISEDLGRALDRNGEQPASGALAGRHVPNLAAFHEYLRGRALLSRADPKSVSASLEHFRKAVELDPKFALAYSSMAEAHYYLWRLGLLASSSAVPNIEIAARRATELDPGLGDPYFWIAYLNMVHHWDWPVAEALYLQGLHASPNSCLGHTLYSFYLLLVNRQEDSLTEIHTALALEPLNLFANVSLANHLRHVRRVDEALAQFQLLLDMAPDHAWGHFLYGWTLLQAGRYEEALEEYEAFRRRSGEIPYTHACMAYARNHLGEPDRARDHHKLLMKVVSDKPLEPYIVAFSYLGLGDHDRALEWLEKAYQARSFVLTYLSIEPIWDPLRGDPRFESLLDRLGRPSP